MFRMVEALEQAGHECTLFLYDRHGSTAGGGHETIVREGWPTVSAVVDDARRGLGGMDAYVATSWDTAHVLAIASGVPGSRLYFIQDFEPYFYARGSMYALAEQTYRFGFVNVALGHMVQQCLRHEIGLDSEFVPFGCDTSMYSVQRRAGRSGVVFYARPFVDRRGYDLAVLALADFATRHPDQPIHVYGGHDVRLPFPVVRHGRLTPRELNDLYNRSVAGIALSFTNISLVAEEMLAAGVVPVVNDSPLARADMPSSSVIWAIPTPTGISNALSGAVSAHSSELPDRVAATARSGWQASQKAFTGILERTVRGSE